MGMIYEINKRINIEERMESVWIYSQTSTFNEQVELYKKDIKSLIKFFKKNPHLLKVWTDKTGRPNARKITKATRRRDSTHSNLP